MTDPDRTFNGGQVVFANGYGGRTGNAWWMGNIRVGGDDAQWDKIVQQARTTYGDSGIHWASGKDLGIAKTGDRAYDRYLVYGDGTRVPDSGQITWTAPNGKRYTAEPDGTYQVFGTGDKIHPASYSVTTDGKLLAFDKDGNPLYAHPGSDLITKIKDDKGWVYDKATGRYTPTASNPNATPPGQGAGSDETGGDGATPEVPLRVTPVYPSWATDNDTPGETEIGSEMTKVLTQLNTTLGSGTPATVAPTSVGYNVPGQGSGTGKIIDTHTGLRGKFDTLATTYQSAQTAFEQAAQASKEKVEAARTAFDQSITDFNTNVAVETGKVKEGDWPALLQEEINTVEAARAAVQKVLDNPTSVPESPGSPGTPQQGGAGNGGGNGGNGTENGGNGSPANVDGAESPTTESPTTESPGTPAPSTTDTSGIDPDIKKLIEQIAATPTTGSPTQTTGQEQQQNPLAGIQNPLSQLGQTGQGTGGSPDISKLLEAINSSGKDKDSDGDIKPIEEEDGKGKGKDGDTDVKPIADPNASGTPQVVNPTPVAPVQNGNGTDQSGSGQQQPAGTPAPAAHPTPAAQPQVKLPDGKIINADNVTDAKAAEAAIADKSGVADQVGKVYRDLNIELPADGKNPGAVVDGPNNAKPGDGMYWNDGTSKVVVAPGLVADGKGGVMTFDEAIAAKPDGFKGFFDPGVKDTFLSPDANPTPAGTGTDQQAGQGDQGTGGQPAPGAGTGQDGQQGQTGQQGQGGQGTGGQPAPGAGTGQDGTTGQGGGQGSGAGTPQQSTTTPTPNPAATNQSGPDPDPNGGTGGGGAGGTRPLAAPTGSPFDNPDSPAPTYSTRETREGSGGAENVDGAGAPAATYSTRDTRGAGGAENVDGADTGAAPAPTYSTRETRGGGDPDNPPATYSTRDTRTGAGAK